MPFCSNLSMAARKRCEDDARARARSPGCRFPPAQTSAHESTSATSHARPAAASREILRSRAPISGAATSIEVLQLTSQTSLLPPPACPPSPPAPPSAPPPPAAHEQELHSALARPPSPRRKLPIASRLKEYSHWQRGGSSRRPWRQKQVLRCTAALIRSTSPSRIWRHISTSTRSIRIWL